ncbi:MAG TPA: hypothetical protein VFG20_14300 [Planctomycetaceae bacterium]|nr:hypothetical protein [Planctomycetaceae bacterium]
MPEAAPILCPKCHRPITMTVQAALQARDLGVAVECAFCNEVWLYRSHPTPMFGPLASPKRRRGRSAPVADENLSNSGDEPDDDDDPEELRPPPDESDEHRPGL